MMMIMIERSEYDDDDVADDQKGQSLDDDVANRKVKVLKTLLIERSKC